MKNIWQRCSASRISSSPDASPWETDGLGTGIRTLEYVDDQGNDGLYDSGQHHHPDRVHFKLLKQDNADSEDHNKKPVCVREGDRCLTAPEV